MPPLTYATYLDLEKLLTMQKPRSTPAEHDEMLFIIIHQTYELWFKQLLGEATVMDHFYDFLAAHGAQIPSDLKNRDLTQPNEPNEQVQKEILRLYKNAPELTILFELMTDFDEGLQEWRYRHIKLVERTIGAKKGTGGSPGVPFLKESLFKPIFHDLWAIRYQM